MNWISLPTSLPLQNNQKYPLHSEIDRPLHSELEQEDEPLVVDPDDYNVTIPTSPPPTALPFAKLHEPIRKATDLLDYETNERLSSLLGDSALSRLIEAEDDVIFEVDPDDVKEVKPSKIIPDTIEEALEMMSFEEDKQKQKFKEVQEMSSSVVDLSRLSSQLEFYEELLNEYSTTWHYFHVLVCHCTKLESFSQKRAHVVNQMLADHVMSVLDDVISQRKIRKQFWSSLSSCNLEEVLMSYTGLEESWVSSTQSDHKSTGIPTTTIQSLLSDVDENLCSFADANQPFVNFFSSFNKDHSVLNVSSFISSAIPLLVPVISIELVSLEWSLYSSVDSVASILSFVEEFKKFEQCEMVFELFQKFCLLFVLPVPELEIVSENEFKFCSVDSLLFNFSQNLDILRSTKVVGTLHSILDVHCSHFFDILQDLELSMLNLPFVFAELVMLLDFCCILKFRDLSSKIGSKIIHIITKSQSDTDLFINIAKQISQESTSIISKFQNEQRPGKKIPNLDIIQKILQ
ncbi:hypothetical protein GEMRC1_003871 [Eukaryota sp. GEM-RC1]